MSPIDTSPDKIAVSPSRLLTDGGIDENVPSPDDSRSSLNPEAESVSSDTPQPEVASEAPPEPAEESDDATGANGRNTTKRGVEVELDPKTHRIVSLSSLNPESGLAKRVRREASVLQEPCPPRNNLVSISRSAQNPPPPDCDLLDQLWTTSNQSRPTKHSYCTLTIDDAKWRNPPFAPTSPASDTSSADVNMKKKSRISTNLPAVFSASSGYGGGATMEKSNRSPRERKWIRFACSSGS